MDFGRGLSISEEESRNFQIQGTWKPATPATPAKPIPAPISLETQGSQISRTNWFESMGIPAGFVQETHSVNGGAACLDSMASLGQSRRVGNWESAMDLTSRTGSGSVVNSHTEAMMNVTAARKNQPLLNLLAWTTGASSSSSANLQGNNDLLFPGMYSASNYNQTQPDSAGMLLANVDPSLSLDFFNQSNYQSQPQNGFPVHHQSYDLNALPTTMTDCISNGAISVPFAPVTPEKGQIIQNQPAERVNESIGERLYKEQDMQEVFVTPNRNVEIELNSGVCSNPFSCMNEVVQLQGELSHPLEGTTSMAASTTLNENHNLAMAADENGIDLNKTPNQKPKRKKHRPKVVVEGKPKKTPKAAAPKPTNDNPNPTGKRKYVRKKGLNNSGTPAAEALGETVEQSPSLTVKSCRRVLNFDMEAQRRDEHPSKSSNNQEFQLNSFESSSRQILSMNPGSHAQDLNHANHGGYGTKSSVELYEGVEVIAENTSPGIDYKCSSDPVIRDYNSLPETQAPAPQSTWRVPPIESSNCHPNNRGEMEKPCTNLSNGNNSHPLIQQHAQAEGINHMAFQTKATVGNNDKSRRPWLQCGSQSLSKCQLDSNSSLHVPFVENVQTEASKRDYSYTVNMTDAQTMNLREVQHNSLQAYQDRYQVSGYQRNHHSPSPQEISKKRRVEKFQYTTIPSSSSSTAAKQIDWGQALQSNHEAGDIEFNNMLGTNGSRNGASKSVRNVYEHTMARENHAVQNVSMGPLLHSSAFFSELQTSGYMLDFGHGERMTKKESKGSTQIQEANTATAIPQCTQLQSSPQKTAPAPGDTQHDEIVRRPKASLADPVAGNYKKRARKATAPVNSVDSSMNQVQQQENQIALYDQHQYLATSKGQPGIPLSYMTPIDDIVQRLKNLDINGETNRIPGSEQNALVPYNGNTTMVPYAGSFDPTRKRRPRPKVDLDPETHRVWRVLMGKEADEGMEQTEKDKDKEKWWEEERRVFRGRADSFIARMHLVQGDRRFSRWKGSVVDSVVGVFLTQNVSDHLSSSAFMSLAARFPLKTKSNERACCKEGIETSLEEPEVSIVETVDTINWHEKLPSQPVCDQSSVTFHEVGHIEEREVANSNESFGSNMGYGSSTDHSRAKQSPVCRISLEMSHDLLPKRTDSLTTNIGVENFTGEDRRAFEDILSSQNSTESTTSRITERNGSCSDSNSEAEDQVTHSPSKRPSDCLDDCTFTELLQMKGSQMFQDIYSCGSGNSLFDLGTKGEQNQAKVTDSNNHNSSMVGMDPLKDLSAHIHPPNSYPPQTQVPIIKSSTCSVKMTQDSGILEVKFPEMLGEERKSPLPSLTSIIGETTHANFTRKQNTVMPETVGENTCQKVQSSAQAEQPADLYGSLNKNQTETLYGLQAKTYGERNPKSFSHRQIPMKEALQSENTMFDEARNLDHTLVERQKSAMDPVSSSTEFSDIVDVETRYLAGQEKPKENNVIQSNVKEQVYNSATGSTKNLNTKKMKMEAGKNKDWDSLRKQAYTTYGEREKSSNTMDSLDWEAVRCANVNEIADAIKERGMNNMLAERIKDFLNRLVREHGAIDLEWLRDVPPDQTKEYLLSIRGLGLKSVECVRLLTLHHLAFPVDTNVGRIAVRLGWVPLQPLPESLQLHLLEMYPMLESIQKYLWPRLCKLDQRTLYELHYQMITFGKVFCTKSKPNCNACPMRGECKHFASAFASARFALPAPEEKSIVSSTVPVAAEHSPTLGINSHTVGINQMPLPLPEAEAYPLTVIAPENRKENGSCEPIIEVPATPEPEYTEISPSDMEDFFDEDPDEIPTIKLNIEEFTMTLENFMQEHSGELQEGDMSKALVALTPEMASIPAPKLKNVSRLRTEHQVYELPDSHHLLKGLDKREPDDPSSYLFAIWTPGETAESIEPPRTNCDSHESGKQCNEKTCFSCNSMREAASRTVRGTLLIPCRTAMRGSFPLNGTYFQVNEVFADHDSSVNPIEVPTAWLWNLPRRTVYFGTSIPTIFKGLTTEGIQHCFWRGLVCVRGFDQKTRAPRPLMARLHFPASRLAKAKDKKK